jgi:ribosomal protein S18 acetylase RimI-like enzyme
MINIRPANKDEVKVLQDLNDEVFIDNQKYDIDLDMNWAQSDRRKGYFTEVLNSPDAFCFIAEENGKEVGYIAAEPKIVSYRKSKYIEIENMGVIPEYRSKGVGSMLMNECLKWAKTQGFQKAFVNAYFDNTMAIDFYKRNGFLEIDVSLEKSL